MPFTPLGDLGLSDGDFVRGNLLQRVIALEEALLPKNPATHVTRGSALSLSSGWNDILWGSEVSDDRGWHSNSTNTERITVDLQGWYLYKVMVEPDGAPTRAILTVGLNGSATSTSFQFDRFELDASTITDPFMTLSGPVFMDPGDYLTTAIYVSGGGPSWDIDVSPIQPYFKVVKL